MTGEPTFTSEGCPAEAAERRRRAQSAISPLAQCAGIVHPLAATYGHSARFETAPVLQRTPAVPQIKRTVYVLRSTSEATRHYVGLTSDVAARVAAHNGGHSDYTAHHRPWRLVASVEFADESSAVRFERYLKSGSGRAFAKRHFP